MNTIQVTHAAPVTYTDLPVRHFNETVRSKVEELKTSLVKKLSAEYSGVADRLIYQAVNEAHALASLTPVPLLFLPTLAEEKVQQAGEWSAHHSTLHQSNSLALAA